MRIVIRVIVVLLVLVALMATLDRVLPEPMARLSIGVQRHLSGLAEKRTQIPGFDIAYLEGGKGDPLVLVHGIGADKDNFDRVAITLTRHFRVYAIDLPGFGDSSKPADGDYGIPAQVAHLDQILDALKLERAHLGGSSMGGWIVGAYAAAHPARVESLWLLDPAGVQSAQESEVRRAYHASGEYLLFAKTPEDYERIIDTVFVHRPYVPYSVRHVLAQRAVANYELHTHIFRTLNDTRDAALETAVAGLPTPTLVVFGDQDRAVDPSAGTILAKVMPNARLILVPGIGHLPMLEAPRQTAEDYLQFRKALEPIAK